MKKRELSDTEYISYLKQHDYEDIIEAEEGKIVREKAGYARGRIQGKTRLKQTLQRVADPEDLDDLDEDLELLDEELEAERTLRNARTHKQRLNGLRKRQED